MITSPDFQSELIDHQKENPDLYREKSTEETIMGTNLVRNYIRIEMERARNPESVTWHDLEDKVMNDKRFTKQQKKQLVATFHQGIFQDTGQQPHQYAQDIPDKNGYVKMTIQNNLSEQKQMRLATKDVPISQLELPPLVQNLPPEFMKSAQKLVENGVENLGATNEKLAQVVQEDFLEKTMNGLDAQVQEVVVTQLVKADPSYAENFQGINERREQAGQTIIQVDEQVMAEAYQKLALQADQAEGTSFQKDTLSQEVNLEQYQAGTVVYLSDQTTATVFESPDGEKLLDVEGLPMTVDLAQDTTNRERMLKEAEVTGMTFCSVEEYLAVMDALNEVFRRGGIGVPDAKLDLTDGISMVGGERDAYLLVRTFLTQMQGRTESAFDAMIQEVGNQESSVTTADEDFRQQLLGYSGSEGIFQRDALMDKFRAFIQQQHNIA